MKILVTGGSGYLGSFLISVLARDKANTIYALDKKPLHQRNHDIQEIKGDISNEKTFRKIPLSELDVVIHLAAVTDQDLCEVVPIETIKTNVVGTYLLVKHASENRIPHLVFASSTIIYGHQLAEKITENIPALPMNLYSTTKLMGENLCRVYLGGNGLSYTIIRIASIYGFGTFARKCIVFQYVNSALSQYRITVPASNSQLDYVDPIHIRDVVDAILKIITNKEACSGDTFNVASGRSYPLDELAGIVLNTVKEQTGRNIELDVSRYHMINPSTSCFSIEQIKQNIGWIPNVTIREGILELMRDQSHVRSTS